MSDRRGCGVPHGDLNELLGLKRGWMKVEQRGVQICADQNKWTLMQEETAFFFFSLNYAAAKSVSTIKAIFIQLN